MPCHRQLFKMCIKIRLACIHFIAIIVAMPDCWRFSPKFSPNSPNKTKPYKTLCTPRGTQGSSGREGGPKCTLRVVCYASSLCTVHCGGGCNVCCSIDLASNTQLDWYTCLLHTSHAFMLMQHRGSLQFCGSFYGPASLLIVAQEFELITSLSCLTAQSLELFLYVQESTPPPPPPPPPCQPPFQYVSGTGEMHTRGNVLHEAPSSRLASILLQKYTAVLPLCWIRKHFYTGRIYVVSPNMI